MLRKGVIRPSSSPWCSPILLAKKKDGTDRFCVDFRKVNFLSKPDRYPLPRIDDIFDALSGARFFSSCDMMSGYWQIPLDDDSMEKTAFPSNNGLFEFAVLPFGLNTAPSSFQRLMDRVFQGLLWTECLVYLDDILIFSKNWEEHISRLENVFRRLEKAGLKLKAKKCSFGRAEMPFLGHVVSKDGIKPGPAKIEAVTKFPVPTGIKTLRSFL